MYTDLRYIPHLRFKLRVLPILKIKRKMEVISYDIVDVVVVADVVTDVVAVVVVEVVVLIDALHVWGMRLKRVRENIIT